MGGHGSTHRLAVFLPVRQLEYPERAALGDRLGQYGHVAAPQGHGAAIADRYANVLLAVLFPGDGREITPLPVWNFHSSSPVLALKALM